MCSPELILDRKRDYILYVVDPEETYKASFRRSHHGGHSHGNNGSHVASSSSGTSPIHGSREPSNQPREPIFVGRGFFGWILEEGGDGDTVVLGKIAQDDEGDEGDDGSRYLDVEIRMKETAAQSREQYFAMLGRFGASKCQPASRSAEDSQALPDRPKTVKAASTSSVGRTDFRPHVSKSSPPRPTVQHAPSKPTFSGPAAPQSQAGLVLQLLQALHAQQQQQQQQQSASQTPLQFDPEHSNSNLPSALAAQPLSSATAQQSPHVSLQRSASAPKPHNLSSSPVPTASCSQKALAAAFEAAGLALPLSNDQIVPLASNTAISAATDRTKKEGLVDDGASASLPTANAPEEASTSEPLLQCYNCGKQENSRFTWRLVVLHAGQKVLYPAAYEPTPRLSNSKDEATIDADGYAIADGRGSWRACNRCGLFFNKYKRDRPEQLESRRKQTTQNTSAKKRARTSADAAGDAEVTIDDASVYDDGEEEDEKDEIEESSPAGGSTPAARLAKVTKPKKRSKPTELVQDQYGQWRSRRSVMENPAGRKPGRPPGAKSGEGSGQSRTQRRRLLQAREAALLSEQNARSLPQHRSTASSPGMSSQCRPDHAQTSPIRQKSSAEDSSHLPLSAATFDLNALPAGFTDPLHTTPGLTPGRRAVRYGVPQHLLMSSPSAAIGELLAGNRNFAGGKASTSFSHGNVTQSSPVRRSPRKNPTGTRDQRNPYATMNANGSPTGRNSGLMMQSDGGLLDMDLFSAFTNFRSPADETSKRPSPKSHSSQVDDEGCAATDATQIWTEDEVRRHGNFDEGPSSSSLMTTVTSPASPSPSQHRRDDVMQRRALLRKSTNVLMASSSPSSLSKASDDATPHEVDDEDQEGVDGSDSPSRARKQRLNTQKAMNDERCLGSPSLGQKRKRDAAVAKGLTARTPTSTSKVGSKASKLDDSEHSSAGMHLTKGPSPAPQSSSTLHKQADLESTTDNRDRGNQELLRTSPAAGATKGSADMLMVPAPPRSSRKPLPATVEDAPSSSAGSSPADDEDGYTDMSPYEADNLSSLLDMFEDPYGLLAANGIGLSGSNASNAVTQGNGTSDSSKGAFVMEHFNEVQLHDFMQFGHQLNNFNQEGNKGVAALAAPDGSNVSIPTARTSPAKASIAGTPREANGVKALTPYSETSKPATPGRKAPSTPSKGTRSSPRFCNSASKTQQPPQTPRGGRRDNEAPSHQREAPRTPNHQSPRTIAAAAAALGLSPSSYALVQAVARSPGGRRMLHKTQVDGTGRSVTTDQMPQTPGALDLSSFFQDTNGNGQTTQPDPTLELNPLLASFGSRSGPSSSMGPLPPFSPGWSKLLSDLGNFANGEQTAQQRKEAEVKDSQVSSRQSAPIPPQALESLQQLMMNDTPANFDAFFAAIGGSDDNGKIDSAQTSGQQVQAVEPQATGTR